MVFIKQIKKEIPLLLDDKLTRPNGIAFSSDEKTLYVANSDPQNPIIKAYDLNKNGLAENGKSIL